MWHPFLQKAKHMLEPVLKRNLKTLNELMSTYGDNALYTINPPYTYQRRGKCLYRYSNQTNDWLLVLNRVEIEPQLLNQKDLKAHLTNTD